MSSGGGVGEVSGENESGSRRSTSGTSDHSGRRSSRDGNYRSGSRASTHVEGHTSGSSSSSSRNSRTSVSRVSSVDEFTGGQSAATDLPAEALSSGGSDIVQTSKKTLGESSSSSASKPFGGFILHEAISPPSEDFEGSFKAGGFEIRMPMVTRSSSDESIGNESSDVRKGMELWGTMVDIKATPSGTEPPRMPLWQKGWKPGPLVCTVPKAADISTPTIQSIDK